MRHQSFIQQLDQCLAKEPSIFMIPQRFDDRVHLRHVLDFFCFFSEQIAIFMITRELQAYANYDEDHRCKVLLILEELECLE